MREKRSKSFSFYFKINLSSVQGRITVAFLLTILINIFLLLMSNYFWKNISQKENRVILQYKPVIYESAYLLTLVKKTQSHLGYYLYLNDDTYYQKSKELWLIEIPEQKKILENTMHLLKDQEMADIFNTITHQLREVEWKEQGVERSKNLENNQKVLQNKVKTDYIFAVDILERKIKKLISMAKHKGNKLQKTIDQDRQWLFRALITGTFLGVFLAYLIGIQLFTGIFQWIKHIRNKLKEISSGNLPEKFEVHHNEFKSITFYTNHLIDNLKAVKNYAQEVGQGNFGKDTPIFESKSTLGHSLTEMRLSLQKVYDEEKKRNWITQGLAEFGEVLRTNSHDLDQLCRAVVSKLVNHLDIVVQGGFFILKEEEEEEKYFELKASFAYHKEKFLKKKVKVNEGLIGRAYNEKEKVYITDLPEDYMQITSSMGQAQPNALIVLPLKTDEQEVKGVIELASIQDFEDYQLAFLDNLCNSITSTLILVITNQEQQSLFEETQKIAKSFSTDLKEQTSAAKTPHQINIQLQQIRREYKKLQSILNHTFQGVLVYNPQGEIDYVNQKTEEIFGYSASELIGRKVQHLIPDLYSQVSSQKNTTLSLLKEKENELKLEAVHKSQREFLITVSMATIDIEEQALSILHLKEV